jgi:multisubunit Na+/H+ antiporter MnhF subunit
VNVWLAAALAPPMAMVPALLGTLRGGVLGRAAAAQVGASLLALELMFLSRAYAIDYLLDLALVLILLSAFGAVAWARMLERWL